MLGFNPSRMFSQLSSMPFRHSGIGFTAFVNAFAGFKALHIHMLLCLRLNQGELLLRKAQIPGNALPESIIEAPFAHSPKRKRECA